MVAAAVVGSAALGAYSASQQSDAAQSAADTQASAANNASQLQYKQFQQLQANQQPYMQLGLSSIPLLMQALGYTAQPGSSSPATGPVAGAPVSVNGQPAGSLTSLGGGGQQSAPANSGPPSGSFYENAHNAGPNGAGYYDANGNFLGTMTPSGGFSPVGGQPMTAPAQSAGQPQSGLNTSVQPINYTANPNAPINQRFNGAAPFVGGGDFNGGAPLSLSTFVGPNFNNPGLFQAPAPFEVGQQFSYDKFNFNPTEQQLEQTPGYQFTLNQGLNNLDSRLAAKGLNLSGAQAKGIADYTTGLADQTYQQQFQNALQGYNTNYGVAANTYNTNFNNRFNAYNANFSNQLNAYNTNFNDQLNAYNDQYKNQLEGYIANTGNQLNQYNSNFNNALNQYNTNYNTGLSTYGTNYNNALNAFKTNYGISSDQYNRLAGLLGLGQNAAAGVGNAGIQTAANMGNAMMSGANAQAAGQIGSANAVSGALGGISNNAMLYSLLNGKGGGGFNPYYQSSYSGFDNPDNYG
jgi:hypothetical protein